MSFLRKYWRGEFSLGFTFWVMGCIAPAPIFIAKYLLREAGVLGHQDISIYLAGQAFLWFEWLYFLVLTVALWNSATNDLNRARSDESAKAIWGHSGRLLAVGSGILAAGSFFNLSGLTGLIFGQPMFIGLGAG